MGDDPGWRQNLRESLSLLHFKISQKPEGFDNAYQLVRTLEKQRQIWVGRDEGMINVPKDQAIHNFLQETKVLNDERKVCISPLISQEN